MRAPNSRSGIGEFLRATGLVAVATASCLAFRAHLTTVDVAMLLLVGVVAVSARHSRGPALFASVLSTAAFDYLFVPPYYTFRVFEPAYFLTFGVMLLVALTMSGLTQRLREEREAAARREEHTAILYAMEADLAAAPDVAALERAIAAHLGRAVGGSATMLVGDSGDNPDGPDPREPWRFADPAISIAARWALENGQAAGWGTRHGAEVPAMLVPLMAPAGPLGLAVIYPPDPGTAPSPEQQEALAALLGRATGALERRLLADRHARAQADVEAERLRTALLSSLSHDLRTPLASIEGSATSLLDPEAVLPGQVRHELLESIVEESQRMTRLVGNLLNMVKVETGMLAVQRSWQPLEEAVGVALLRMEDRLSAHPVAARIPSDLPMVPIDELLIEQVLLNLLENAVRYSPPGAPIEVTARREADAVLVEVLDHGPGIPAGEEERVFDRFFRGSNTAGADASPDSGAGAGLGLTICRGIIMAHGGRIWAHRPVSGGTAIRFTLPLSGQGIGGPPPSPESA